MPTYPHPRPAFTVDVVLLAQSGEGLYLLLIERGREPFRGCWALPGGFVEENEPPLLAARRELAEETGLEAGELRHFAAFADPGRDPRGWTVTMAYVGAPPPGGPSLPQPTGGDDAAAARWWPVGHLPPLAFDHHQIITQALAWAKKAGFPMQMA